MIGRNMTSRPLSLYILGLPPLPPTPPELDYSMNRSMITGPHFFVFVICISFYFFCFVLCATSLSQARSDVASIPQGVQPPGCVAQRHRKRCI